MDSYPIVQLPTHPPGCRRVNPTVFYSSVTRLWIHSPWIWTYPCHIQGKPGGIRDSHSCGCATEIREYLFNISGLWRHLSFLFTVVRVVGGTHRRRATFDRCSVGGGGSSCGRLWCCSCRVLCGGAPVMCLCVWPVSLLTHPAACSTHTPRPGFVYRRPTRHESNMYSCIYTYIRQISFLPAKSRAGTTASASLPRSRTGVNPG